MARYKATSKGIIRLTPEEEAAKAADDLTGLAERQRVLDQRRENRQRKEELLKQLNLTREDLNILFNRRI